MIEYQLSTTSTMTTKSTKDKFYLSQIRSTNLNSQNKTKQTPKQKTPYKTPLKSSKSVSRLTEKSTLSNLNNLKDLKDLKSLRGDKSSRSKLSRLITDKSTMDPQSNRRSVNSLITPRKQKSYNNTNNNTPFSKRTPTRIIKNNNDIKHYLVTDPDVKYQQYQQENVIDISKIITLDHNINEDLFLMEKNNASQLFAHYEKDDIFGQSLLYNNKVPEIKIEFVDVLEQMWSSFKK